MMTASLLRLDSASPGETGQSRLNYIPFSRSHFPHHKSLDTIPHVPDPRTAPFPAVSSGCKPPQLELLTAAGMMA